MILIKGINGIKCIEQNKILRNVKIRQWVPRCVFGPLIFKSYVNICNIFKLIFRFICAFLCPKSVFLYWLAEFLILIIQSLVLKCANYGSPHVRSSLWCSMSLCSQLKSCVQVKVDDRVFCWHLHSFSEAQL